MLFQLSRIGLLIGLSSLVLSGCGLFAKKAEDKLNALPEFQEEFQLRKVWSANIGSGLGKKYDKITPVISGDQLYVSDVNGNVMAFNRVTGAKTWLNKLSLPVTGGVSVGYGLVLVGTSDGEVLALNQETGEVVWRNRVSSEVLSKPTIQTDVVIVQTLDDKLFAFDTQTGEKRWVHGNTVPALTLRGTSSPVVNSENVVIAGFSSGKLTGLNANNGVVRWEQRIAIPSGRSDIERIADIDGKLLMTDDMIYATSFKGTVVAMSSSTGRMRWQRDIASYVGAGAVEGYVFIADSGGKLWALDESTSASLWKQEGLHGRKLTSPVPYKSFVAVGDYEGYLHLVSQTDGRFVSRLKVGGNGFRVEPVVIDDMIYVYSNNGKLVALQVN